ncbi:MAG: hypothetical protein ACTHU0_02650, partial [Kofleriaceae bacterium]
MWGPIHWRGDADRKVIENVVGVSILVVDVDHVPSDDQLAGIYERVAQWRHFLHASHSDRPGDRCVRVALAVSREMTAREFNRVRRVVLEMLDLPADPNAADCSRLFYLPTRPRDACHDAVDGTGYLFASGDGKVLDVDAILALGGPEDEPSEPSTFEIPSFAGAPSAEAIGVAARALGEAWPDENRHGAQLALAGALARAGWPVALIADFCARVAEVQEPGNGNLSKRTSAARSSVEKAHRGVNVAGWPTVIEYVGEDAVAETRRLLGMHTAPQADPAFVAQMTALAARAAAPTAISSDPATSSPPSPPSPPTSTEVRASLKSAQKRLATRKDASSLRDAELLKRVTRGDFLTDDVDEDRATALVQAALVVARAAPPNTAPEQLIRELLPSAGALAADLPEVVALATEHARQMPPLLSRGPSAPGGLSRPFGDAAGELLEEFVLETQGPRHGRPVNGSQHN